MPKKNFFKTFLKFLTPKNFINPYGRNWLLEQPLDFTGCSSIQFFNSHPFPEHSQLAHTWHITPHCAVLVWLTWHHATLWVTKRFPPNHCLGKQKISLGVASILRMCLILSLIAISLINNSRLIFTYVKIMKIKKKNTF